MWDYLVWPFCVQITISDAMNVCIMKFAMLKTNGFSFIGSSGTFFFIFGFHTIDEDTSWKNDTILGANSFLY